MVITPKNSKLFKNRKKLILPDVKIFVNSFCSCNYQKTWNFFFSNETHFELNVRVNKQNIRYRLADNPNWQITKLRHSEWVIVGVCHFTVLHHRTSFGCGWKRIALLVLIPCGMKRCWKLFFSELKKRRVVQNELGFNTTGSLHILLIWSFSV